MKILLFEDCKDRIANFKNWFKKYNIDDVLYCQDARDCIKLLKENKYDLIFLDHDMERVSHPEPYDEKIHSGTVVAQWWNSSENKNIETLVIIHSVNSDKALYMNKSIPNSLLIRRIYHQLIFENLLKLSNLLVGQKQEHAVKKEFKREEIKTKCFELKDGILEATHGEIIKINGIEMA